MGCCPHPTLPGDGSGRFGGVGVPGGPCDDVGVLSPSDTDSVDPVVPTRVLSSLVFECAGPPGPVGTLLPGRTGLCPIVPTGELLSVVAVLLLAVRDQAITQLPVEGLVGDCGDVVDENITVHGGWSVPEVAKTPAVVAMVGCDVMPMGNDTPSDCVDNCTEWDMRDQFETIDGMAVYHGGDLCDSDESDWDDLYDIASAEYVEQYNFDVPERMELMVFERCRGRMVRKCWKMRRLI